MIESMGQLKIVDCVNDRLGCDSSCGLVGEQVALA